MDEWSKEQRANATLRFSDYEFWLPCLNSLDHIASYFVSGVADEELGYELIGNGFCEHVERYYDIICIITSFDTDWQSERCTILLYKKWIARKRERILHSKKESIDNELRTLIADIKSKSWKRPFPEL
jgi:hypothetical protein